jgi:hypothetical protein
MAAAPRYRGAVARASAIGRRTCFSLSCLSCRTEFFSSLFSVWALGFSPRNGPRHAESVRHKAAR